MATDRVSWMDEFRTRLPTPALVAWTVAVGTGGLVYWIAITIFSYLSSNNDEGVYLQQAAMLLDGRLVMQAGDLAGSFRPWFFVVDGGAMYPKYTPVPAGVFALGKWIFGSFDPILAVVAALNVLLVYVLVTAAFDRSTAVLATFALVGSPLFLVTSATFLPYAPTTAFNLAFALAYVRAVRREHLGYAAFAGTAIGLAFFSRPYTAVLFALPFVVHATVVLARAWGEGSFRSWLARYATVAAFGLAFVGLTLWYNATLTGDPLLFPYEAFAPRDGLGFGRREILGYERTYDLPLALRANALVLRDFATDWMVAGPIGTVLAVLGAAVAPRGESDESPLPDRTLRMIFLGIVASVVLGNVAFWGNLNILAALSNPDDGLITLLGPFYHFDLLLPVSAFVAVGVRSVVRALTSVANQRFAPERARVVLLVALVVSAPVVAITEQRVVEPKLDANAAFSEKYERAYQPFETREFENGLVFLPTPYGDWLNHPFQHLRNDPDLDGDRVFAIQRGPDDDFAVVDAYPNRTLYRYTYRGRWVPAARPHVEPALQELSVQEGTNLTVRTAVGVPESSTSASVRLSNGDEVVRYDVGDELDENLTVAWAITPNGTRAVGGDLRPSDASEQSIVPLSSDHPTVLSITFTQPGGATVTYHQRVRAVENGTQVRVLWPPETSVCRLVSECGREGTYLPEMDDYLPGVSVNTTIADGEEDDGTESLATVPAGRP